MNGELCVKRPSLWPDEPSLARWWAITAASVPLVRAVVSAALAVVIATSVLAGPAFAKKRHAFIVGISNYGKASGLPKLNAPVHDAEALRDALQSLRQRFDVTLVSESEAGNRAAFDSRLNGFLDKVSPGDEVLFYFSGHGNYLPGRGNVFLLPDAKSEDGYVRGLSNAEANELSTADLKTKRYQEWLSQVAVSESEVENAIRARKPDVVIIVADACRSLLSGTKGVAGDIGGVRLPQHSARGVYRLYSASVGQISLDSPEPIVKSARTATGATPSQRPSKAVSDDDDDDGKRKKGPTNSLFTKALLNEIAVPGLEFEVMAAQVKVAVRTHASKLGYSQIPDFNGEAGNTGFTFAPAEARDQLDDICRSAASEIARLRAALAAGSIGRDVLERQRYELSRCGRAVAVEIEALLRLEALGAGAVLGGTRLRAPEVNPNDPAQACEIQASSPHDPNSPVGLQFDALREVSLRSLGGDVPKAAAIEQLRNVQEVCERALADRPRVARFNYLAGRVHQTISTLSEGIDQQRALAAASAYFQRAADAGYPAAFNDLAVMHKDGQFYQVANGVASVLPADRAKAAELFKRGASLNHPVAQYNLGMAYLNGDLGIEVSADDRTAESQTQRNAKAFEHFSQAAERGFVPALIETAKLLFWGRGVPENEKRSIELLEIAASRGSWDAMHLIGDFYRQGWQIRDLSRAIIWYARAAEAGDARAQEQLAWMMTEGQGLPAPQLEAAGRYWRLAADAGRRGSQVRLATLIRDGVIPFRPVVTGRPDRGAAEIQQLYLAAFARGNPKAGLELARLYRTGFPKDDPSAAIPRSRDQAVRLLWDTIEKVRQADPDSWDADPKVEVWAAFELISIYDEEGQTLGRSSVITEDQIAQLRQNYGDGSRQQWIRSGALGPTRCGGYAMGDDHWVLVWNWSRPEPPTEMQFDWYQRVQKCKEVEHQIAKREQRKPPTDDKIGFTKALRDVVLTEHKAALKDTDKKGGKSKSFVDRIVEKVSKPKT